MGYSFCSYSLFLRWNDTTEALPYEGLLHDLLSGSARGAENNQLHDGIILDSSLKAKTLAGIRLIVGAFFGQSLEQAIKKLLTPGLPALAIRQ